MFPILSAIIFTPLIAGLDHPVAARQPQDRGTGHGSGRRPVVTLALSVWAYFAYNIPAGGYQLVEKIPWLPALGISYYLGMDGISAPLVLLGGVVLFCGVLISWGVEDRPREFFAFLMFLGDQRIRRFLSLWTFLSCFSSLRSRSSPNI